MLFLPPFRVSSVKGRAWNATGRLRARRALLYILAGYDFHRKCSSPPFYLRSFLVSTDDTRNRGKRSSFFPRFECRLRKGEHGTPRAAPPAPGTPCPPVHFAFRQIRTPIKISVRDHPHLFICVIFLVSTDDTRGNRSSFYPPLNCRKGGRGTRRATLPALGPPCPSVHFGRL